MVRPRSCRVIYYFDTPALGTRHQLFDRVNYHPGKANVVADALSRKRKTVINDIEIKEQESIVELKKMGLQLSVGPEGSLLA